MQSATILVVEDEQHILDVLVTCLRADGFSVHTASDGFAAVEQARTVLPDLVILDLMLPGIDGLEVCRRIQQERDVYVLMLTARADEIDRIIGLSIGADDYMAKPFSPRELLVRVKALLRRSRPLGGRAGGWVVPRRPPLTFDYLTIDPSTHDVICRNTRIDLTPREFELLYALAEEPNRVFTREQLLERVWGYDFAGVDRVVDVHVGMLRRKLEEDPANPLLIQTVRGVGYKFVGKRRMAKVARQGSSI
jgi:two-component system alkaline phosphatase synthesis response regulator PhoP